MLQLIEPVAASGRGAYTEEARVYNNASVAIANVTNTARIKVIKMTKTFPQGKGLYVWQIKEMPDNWVSEFTRMGLKWIAVKVSDGISSYNLRYEEPTGKWVDDILGPFIETAKSAGFLVFGWSYIYGNYPTQEADKAAERVEQFDLAGFIIDAEHEYKSKSSQATQFSNRIRQLLPDRSISLSTYRFPESHPTFPYNEFLAVCDYNAPQVYWNKGRAAVELIECDHQYSKFTGLSMVPAGRSYEGEGFPRPTPAETEEFLVTAEHDLLCTGAFFWSADALYKPSNPLPEIVDAIAAYDWRDGTDPDPDPNPTESVTIQPIVVVVDEVEYISDSIICTKRS